MPLLLSIGFLLMGNGLQNIFLILKAHQEGFSIPIIGSMASCYFIGFLWGCQHHPKNIAAIGHVRLFSAMSALVCTVALTQSLLIDEISWLVFRIFSGYAMAGLYIVIESWINEFSVNQNRGRILSIYRLVDLISNMSGQFVLFFTPISGSNGFVLMALLMSLSALPIALARGVQPRAHQQGPPLLRTFRNLWQLSPLGVVGAFLVGMNNSTFWTLGPVYFQSEVQAFGPPALLIAYLLGGTASTWPVGALSDRIDRRLVIACTSILGGCVALCLWLWPVDPFLILALVTALGMSVAPIYALTIAHANDQLREGHFVSSSSSLLFISSLGSILGPFLSSWIVAWTTAAAVFQMQALFLFGLGFYSLYRMSRRIGVPRELKSPFQPFPRTTPEVLQLNKNLKKPGKQQDH